MNNAHPCLHHVHRGPQYEECETYTHVALVPWDLHVSDCPNTPEYSARFGTIRYDEQGIPDLIFNLPAVSWDSPTRSTPVSTIAQLRAAGYLYQVGPSALPDSNTQLSGDWGPLVVDDHPHQSRAAAATMQTVAERAAERTKAHIAQELRRQRTQRK